MLGFVDFRSSDALGDPGKTGECLAQRCGGIAFRRNFAAPSAHLKSAPFT
jgi:hypothetical protein